MARHHLKKTSGKKRKWRFGLETVELILVTRVKSQSSLDMLKRCKDSRKSCISSLLLDGFPPPTHTHTSTGSLVHMSLSQLSEKEGHETFRDLLYRKEKSQHGCCGTNYASQALFFPIHPQLYTLPSLPSAPENDLTAKFITNFTKLI